MIGRRLLHYEITDKLGEGGMGVVYKARDTHLDRFVAIKVLPSEKLAHLNRKARFVQEARAASALNHPNIIQIYDIEPADGADFIVMEYVPGKTLDHVIGRRGLGLSESLKYAVQIAHALAAAHAAGIIHRDLKPTNIMVTNEGVVKLLDFGLAKLLEPEQTSPDDSTLTSPPLTEEGTVMGTAAYMSPEQAEGKKVDARSDIFSFGSVLYEMVTGRRAFQGNTNLSMLAAILEKEPPPASTLGANVPHDLEKIITRCLRKDPDRRFQHMDDVKIALEELKEESDSDRLKVEPSRLPAHWRGKRLVLVMTVILVLAVGAVGWRLMRFPRPDSAPVLTRLTFDVGLSTDPVVSPDGKLLAYVSDRGGRGNLDLWVQHLSGGQPIRLTQAEEDVLEPSFSPDGAKIAFRWERDGGGIYAISSLGGEPRLIAKQGRRPVFSPDGSQIAYWIGEHMLGAKIYIAAADGRHPQALQLDFSGAFCPIWTPDGKRLLFAGADDAAKPVDWWFTPVEGGSAIKTGAMDLMRSHGMPAGRVMIFTGELSNFFVPAAWTADGRGVLFSGLLGNSSNLWEAVISPANSKATALRRLSSGTGFETQPSAVKASVVFASLTYSHAIWSLPLLPNDIRITGEMQPITRGAAIEGIPSLSADGTRLVFTSNRSGGNQVWMKNLDLGRETMLTTMASTYYPRISADGSTVAYRAYENQTPVLYTVPTVGGLPEKKCENCGVPADFSPDGTKLLCHLVDGNRRTLLLNLRSDERIGWIAHPQYLIVQPHFSPDGRWIAFHSDVAPERVRLFVVPVREGPVPQEKDWIPITEGNTIDRDAGWSPNGNLLYFFSERDGFRCLWAQRLDSATKRPAAPPIPILHLHSRKRALRNVAINLVSISVARDKIVFPLAEVTGEIWKAEWGHTSSSSMGR
jgi:serine/threonine protein kinase/Tol biopolymer transport system component